ncbi:hypothetical protein PMIN03_010888 [Paraphaeosphaeria minitans]
MKFLIAVSEGIKSVVSTAVPACVRKFVVRRKALPDIPRTSSSTSATRTTRDGEVCEADSIASNGAETQTWEVVKLANGLVSLGKTPPWLVEAVDRNARESALIRLPAEIRMMIWQYVLAGTYINVSMWWSQTTCDGGSVYCIGPSKLLARGGSFRGTGEVPAALRPPHVCRAIYFDTAPIAYQGIIIFFNSHTLADVWAWATRLAPARRNSISDMAVCKACLSRHYPALDLQGLRLMFQTLQRVHVYGPESYERYICADEDGVWKAWSDS